MDEVLELNYLPYLPQDKSASILDFGCGSGRVMNFLDQLGYKNITGVDIDSIAVKAAPQTIQNKIVLTNNISEFLSKSALKFDCVIAKDVIYYFPREDVLPMCRALFSTLIPSGVAIVEVFNGALTTAGFTAFKDAGIQTYYTETSLAQIMKGSGLEVVTIFGQINKIKSLKSILYLTARKIWILFLKMILIIERGIDPQNPKIYTKSIIGIGRKIR